ncbi:MAG: plasmid maintenance system killer [Acidobacteria bacterium]|nr:plasmid maintenance system killer [Acidobacteriota bacterium]
MIRSFANSQTERLFLRERLRRLSANVQRLALRRLLYLDGAERLADLRLPPGNRLEKLRGNRAGQYSIRINDQWRICFRWRDGDAYNAEITDYH